MKKISVYTPLLLMPRYRQFSSSSPSITAEIEKISHDGRGIARIEGKTVFIAGGLPGETVTFRYVTRQKQFDEGRVINVIQSAPERVTPPCPHFGECGGCSLQHIMPAAQIAFKQATLLEQFQHIGKVEPASIIPPLQGLSINYRRKARLSVRYVAGKQSVLVGFREQYSNHVAELTCCKVLHASVGEQLLALRELIGQFVAHDKIAQVEVAVGDTQTALIFRNLVPLVATDLDLLRQFAQTTGFYIYLQPAGPQSIAPFFPAEVPLASLHYRLSSENLAIHFAPQDFVQINHEINQQMVTQALTWLQLQPQDKVLDLFCGLGNFTLPSAQHAAWVTGVEGDASLLERAQANAQQAGIENVSYEIANLADPTLKAAWLHSTYDKVLLDPPRSGALEIIRQLPFTQTQRLVYVSCNPATLARDAEELVHRQGFHLVQTGVMDMFPHTAHVESMALFERK